MDNSLLVRLKCRSINGGDSLLEENVVAFINALPYEAMSCEQKKKLLPEDYEPGTFYISERSENTAFLFDEPSQSFYDWYYESITGELRQLKKNSQFNDRLIRYGENELIKDTYEVLSFKVSSGVKFYETIPNQEYSDVFRRIILFLLFNDPNYEINSYREFNELGLRLIPTVLAKGQYTLKQRLIQSIYSGLIGMDIKDELAATSPLSREKIIALSGSESDEIKQQIIFDRLDYVAMNCDIDVNSWDSFDKLVVRADSITRLCWFTDDFIPTLFEMKFMENLLSSNHNIIITIIPRVQSYSNDASWSDVKSFLKLPVFDRLSRYATEGRFIVCEKGMAGGAFNGLKLSKECAEVVESSDYVVIAGARSYEMGQGLMKHTFFTGIAVCRTYSETVTGVCKDDGGIVFLEQLPGEKSFKGFRSRSFKKCYCKLHDRWFPVAEQTALDYLKGRVTN